MRYLFAIISCHKNKHRRDAVRNTWMSEIGNLADYKFFVGNGETELEEDVVKLDVADDYDNLPWKVKAVCQWALDKGYDYILKVDDDTYVFPERMFFELEGKDYYGRHNIWASPVHPQGFCSGFAYWLSAKAAAVIARGTPNHNAEDRWVGGELSRNGIVGASDKRYYVLDVIGKPLWSHFIRIGACFAQLDPGIMEYFDSVVKGKVIIENLPATGRTAQLTDPRSGQKFRIGHVHKPRSR